MPWFLNPSAYAGLPLYQNPELYYFVAKLLAAVLFTRMLWRRGVRGPRLFAGAWGFFFGLFLVVMLSLHATVITGLRLLDRPEGVPFDYNFHFYSLLLLAAVLITQGVRCLRSAAALAEGDPAAHAASLRATLIVLAVAIPMIPIQFFGAVLTLMGSINLGALALSQDKPQLHLVGGADDRSSRPLRVIPPARSASR